MSVYWQLIRPGLLSTVLFSMVIAALAAAEPDGTAAAGGDAAKRCTSGESTSIQMLGCVRGSDPSAFLARSAQGVPAPSAIAASNSSMALRS